MTGLDDDDFGADDFRPVPHPDDRLWRHPAEVAAELAAQRAAAASPEDMPTAELPTVATATAVHTSPRPTLRRGLLVGAGVATLAAVTIFASGRVGPQTETVRAVPLAASSSLTAAAPTIVDEVAVADRAEQPAQRVQVLEVASNATSDHVDQALAERVLNQTATSLPRVQAATLDGMREGSGFFATPDGHVVTSASLVEGSDYLLVWTTDGGRWHADVVAVDHFSDVAILRTTGAPAVVATFKDGDQVWTGQYALAVDHTTTTMRVGSVASLTDAAPATSPGDRSARLRVDPGMAPGAAIVDDTGSIIGLVNGGAHTQATPGWMVERVTNELLGDGMAVHPWLGVDIEATDSASDAVIVAVIADSPAAAAGLRAGDRIDAVNDVSISPTHSLWTLVQQRQPGDVVHLAVTRNGERRLVIVELAGLIG